MRSSHMKNGCTSNEASHFIELILLELTPFVEDLSGLQNPDRSGQVRKSYLQTKVCQNYCAVNT